MLTRQDVVFTIGYDGNAALVDRAARNHYGKKTTDELIEAGLFRAAAASALYADSADELVKVASAYNKAAGTRYSVDEIPRLFGVAKSTVARSLAL